MCLLVFNKLAIFIKQEAEVSSLYCFQYFFVGRMAISRVGEYVAEYMMQQLAPDPHVHRIEIGRPPMPDNPARLGQAIALGLEGRPFLQVQVQIRELDQDFTELQVRQRAGDLL
jgi:hypothetical protein